MVGEAATKAALWGRRLLAELEGKGEQAMPLLLGDTKDIEEIDATAAELQSSCSFQEVMNIRNFIYPVDEDIHDSNFK
jgi:hypothetical protein